MKPGPSRAVTFRTRYESRFDRAKARLRRCPDSRVRATFSRAGNWAITQDATRSFGHEPPDPAKDRASSCRMGGSDGDRLREIDVVSLPLIPFLYPERVLRARRRSGVGRYAPTSKGPRFGRDHWRQIAARAQREGLRGVARDLGVSHETMRAICKQVSEKVAPTEDVPALLALAHRE